MIVFAPQGLSPESSIDSSHLSGITTNRFNRFVAWNRVWCLCPSRCQQVVDPDDPLPDPLMVCTPSKCWNGFVRLGRVYDEQSPYFRVITKAFQVNRVSWVPNAHFVCTIPYILHVLWLRSNTWILALLSYHAPVTNSPSWKVNSPSVVPSRSSRKILPL